MKSPLLLTGGAILAFAAGWWSHAAQPNADIRNVSHFPIMEQTPDETESGFPADWKSSTTRSSVAATRDPEQRRKGYSVLIESATSLATLDEIADQISADKRRGFDIADLEDETARRAGRLGGPDYLRWLMNPELPSKEGYFRGVSQYAAFAGYASVRPSEALLLLREWPGQIPAPEYRILFSAWALEIADGGVESLTGALTQLSGEEQTVLTNRRFLQSLSFQSGEASPLTLARRLQASAPSAWWDTASRTLVAIGFESDPLGNNSKERCLESAALILAGSTPPDSEYMSSISSKFRLSRKPTIYNKLAFDLVEKFSDNRSLAGALVRAIDDSQIDMFADSLNEHSNRPGFPVLASAFGKRIKDLDPAAAEVWLKAGQ